MEILGKSLLVASLVLGCCIFCVNSLSSNDFLNKCISSTNHKNVPGIEGTAMEAFHCKPWQNRSCCTWNTTSQINKDGTLSLYGIVWDQCPQNQNMSEKCKKHFMKDTCFYECSPNLGPWIVEDHVSKKTRKERVQNVPICASDCDAWYNDCRLDYTCNDNWGKNWIWSKKGTPDMCPKQCKMIGEYFSTSKEFCENIFDRSFKYETDKKRCMNLTPAGSKNEDIAMKKAQELASNSIKVNCYGFLVFVIFILSGTTLL